MTSEGLLRIVQALILVAFVLHRAYYNRKYPPAEEETVEEQARGGPRRIANLLALPALVSVVLFLIYPRWMDWSAIHLAIWVRWAGVLVAVTGFGLLQWSHQALGRNWSDQPRITRTQSLVTIGPYRWIRHPIYTSFLMILGSSLLISANWFIGSIWLAMTAIDIRSRIDFEEAKLLTRFGETYDSYKRETGGLLPRLR